MCTSTCKLIIHTAFLDFTVLERVMDQDVTDSHRRDFETVIAIEEDVAARVERGEACSSCSINVECNEDVVVRVCRICHLSSKESGMSVGELIELGCGCKGELGVAHSQCAQAWFRVRGNRLCEICGDAPRNVGGVCDSRFMEEWNEGRWVDGGDDNSQEDGSRRCSQGQPICNLLMACLVIAFILPWFFRVNLF